MAAAALLVAVHAAFFGFQLAAQDPFLSDSFEYLAAARNLASEGVLYAGDLAQPLDPALYTKRPPLYPLLLVATGAHTGFFGGTLLIQNLLSLFSWYLVFLLYRRIASSEQAGRAALPLLMLFPSQFIYANMIMSEILLQALITSAFYGFVRYALGDGNRYLLLYSVLLAAAALTKPVMYVFLLPNVLLMIVLGVRGRDVRPVVYSLLPIVVIGVYGVWNAHRTGHFHVSSIQTASLLDYNVQYFLVHEYGPQLASALVEDVHHRAARAGSFAERQHILHTGAWDLIRPRFFPYLLFHLRGTAALFLDPGRFDLYNFLGLAPDGNGLLYHFSRGGQPAIRAYLSTQPLALVAALIVIAAGNVVRIACLAAAWWAPVRAEVKWGMLLLIAVVALATGPVGAARFAVPVFPVIVLAALLALLNTRSRRRSAQDRAVSS